jgi:hypothetical protein
MATSGASGPRLEQAMASFWLRHPAAEAPCMHVLSDRIGNDQAI